MKKSVISFISVLMAVSFNACGTVPDMQNFLPVNQQVSVFNASTNEIPEFSKRKLGTMNIPVNSVNEQKNKQIKLNTYYFKSYSSGGNPYSVTDTNDHMKMLQKAEKALNVALDANGDKKIPLDEISKFVTSDAYIKYFRETYITYSFNKLDTASDKKLSVDEFNLFNKVIKAKELPDFQLLEEFAEYDYNSSRNLEIEEYEDFFMKYLLLKVGAAR